MYGNDDCPWTLLIQPPSSDPVSGTAGLAPGNITHCSRICRSQPARLCIPQLSLTVLMLQFQPVCEELWTEARTAAKFRNMSHIQQVFCSNSYHEMRGLTQKESLFSDKIFVEADDQDLFFEHCLCLIHDNSVLLVVVPTIDTHLLQCLHVLALAS